MKKSFLADKNKKSLFFLFLTLFIDLIGFSIIFPLFPSILQHYFHDAPGQTEWVQSILQIFVNLIESRQGNADFLTTVLFGGLLAALYSFLQFIFAPMWGSLSDKIGRRKTLLIILSGILIAYVMWIFSGSFTILILSRILAGSMSGNIAVVTAGIADVTDRKKRTRGMALIGMAFGFGFLVGPALGGLLSKINLLETFPQWAAYGINPFSIPAAVACLFTIANLFFVYFKLQETFNSPSEHIKFTINPLKKVLYTFITHSKEARITNLINLLMITSFSSIEFSITFLARERFDYTSAQNSLIFIYSGIVMIIGHSLIRKLSHAMSVKGFIFSGLALGIVAFTILSQSYSLWLFYFGLTLMAIATSIANPSLLTASSSLAEGHSLGKSLGAFRSAGSLARVFGPLCGAAIFFSFGIEIAYCSSATLLLAPIILTFALPHIEQSK